VTRTARVLESPRAPRFEAPRDLGVDDLGPAVVGVEDARLTDLELAGARLDGVRFADVEVLRGNWANVVGAELTLTRVVVSGARLTGAAWTRGRVVDTVFRDCRIDLATFAGTTFDRVRFDDCRLVQTDFRDALLRSVRFDRCDLTEADVVGVRIDRCELRSCTLDGLAGVERLRGAAMPWADVVGNAALLAGALGIRVIDEEERRS
jgi:uncharacterized protein YjbI with pentapeptide repeats